MSDFSQPTPHSQDAPVNTGQPIEFTPDPLPEPPILPFTMKANLAEYRKRLGVWRITIAVILMAVVYVRFGLVAGIIATTVSFLIILLVLIGLSKRSITLHEDHIEYHGAFGRVTNFAYSDISTVKVFLAYIEPTFGHAPRIIVGKIGGGFYFTLITLYWNVEDIDLLLATLNAKQVPNESYADPAVSAMIAKQFPDYVSAYERHPYWIAFGIILIIIVAVVGFVLATM